MGAGGGQKEGLALVRFAPGSASHDPSFGNGEGIVVGPSGAAKAVSLDAGKILVAGYSGYAGTASSGALLDRYAADGTFDPGFGSAGVVRLQLAGSVASQLNDVAIAPDGSIFAVGTTFSGFDPDFPYRACKGCTQTLVAKLTPSGSLDPSFGEGGMVRLGGGPAPATSGEDIALLGDGRLLVSGTAEGASHPFVLARLTPAGQLDPSFAASGVATTVVCPGNDRQRRANGCLPSARVSLQIRNLAGPRPLLRLRPNVSWARISSVQLVLPKALRVDEKRIERKAGFAASVPGRAIPVKAHPPSLNFNVGLGSARSLSTTLWRRALQPVGPFPRGKKLSFRVVVKFGEPTRDEGQQTVVLERRG